jgi:hypothetical protein
MLAKKQQERELADKALEEKRRKAQEDEERRAEEVRRGCTTVLGF